MKLRFAVRFFALLVLVCPVHAFALWTPNGVPLSTAVNVQQWPAITTDGAAGAIVAWYDKRNGNNFDIYVQRVNAMGQIMWALDGIALCVAAHDQINPTITSDGAGGAIVTWWDFRSGTDYDIYVQRVNAAGAVQWTANGVALCTARNDQRYPVPTTDGAGGAIVAWDDIRSGGGDIDIYAQRISAAGVTQWTADGVALCVQPYIEYVPAILSDGVGGAFVTWADFRNGTDYDIYGQHINGAGSTLWAANGLAICAGAQASALQSMATDQAGGAIVAWMDDRNGPDWDIYAQRVDAAGSAQWTPGGAAICLAIDSQGTPAIASDGSGGAIIAWDDLRNPITGRDIYAQRIDDAGDTKWTLDGVPLCVVRQVQSETCIVPDASGGAIVAWYDVRNGVDFDIFVQRVDAFGTPLWTINGVALCFAAESQFGPKIVSDSGGGAIVAWHDLRNGNYDIYAQRIGQDGLIPTAVRDTPSFARVVLSLNAPNPFSDRTAMELDLPADARVKIEVHDVAGHLVRRAESLSLGAGAHRLSFDGRDDAGHPLASGVYFYSVRTLGETRMRKLTISR